MVRAVAIVFFLMFAAGPVWAAGAEPFDPDAPFQEGLTTSLLRSLFNQAFDQLEDHLEILGKLDPDDGKGDRQGACSSSSIQRASPNQTSISVQKAGSTSNRKAGSRIGISDLRCRKIGRTPRSSLRNRSSPHYS